MASKGKLKGLTVEIGGDTTKLDKRWRVSIKSRPVCLESWEKSIDF